MSYDYDKLYASEAHALGEQTAEIAAFIAGLNLKGARILDVGCGQGRDALPLARAGHDVTGVDLAPSGIEAMCAEADAEGLSITGHVADITEYPPPWRVRYSADRPHVTYAGCCATGGDVLGVDCMCRALWLADRCR